MSNNGVFYLDAASRPAAKMWLNITALGGATPAQAELLLGGETSMWQDQYVHSCLFANSQDANFSESVSGCVWPRAAIAAGSFWGFYSATKGLDQATFDATHRRPRDPELPLRHPDRQRLLADGPLRGELLPAAAAVAAAAADAAARLVRQRATLHLPLRGALRRG
jgi:hypothetical protein